MVVFASRLNKTMQENNCSAYKLSKAIGVNNQTVINWQNGMNEPKITCLRKIAEYFDVSSDYLLGLSDI